MKVKDLKQTDNTMAKKEKTNRQKTVHKTQHRQLKTKQHEPPKKTRVISSATEE